MFHMVKRCLKSVANTKENVKDFLGIPRCEMI